MRAWEILENRVTPSRPITVRHLHKLKKEEHRRLAVDQERKALIPIMYGSTKWHQEQLELERTELELAQMRAEVAGTKAETKSKTKEAISDMARSGIKAENQTEQTIVALARRGLDKGR